VVLLKEHAILHTRIVHFDHNMVGLRLNVDRLNVNRLNVDRLEIDRLEIDFFNVERLEIDVVNVDYDWRSTEHVRTLI
jgi:hypothetical protein